MTRLLKPDSSPATLTGVLGLPGRLISTTDMRPNSSQKRQKPCGFAAEAKSGRIAGGHSAREIERGLSYHYRLALQFGQTENWIEYFSLPPQLMSEPKRNDLPVSITKPTNHYSCEDSLGKEASNSQHDSL